MRPVAAFDTNILLSAIGWKGKPLECVELARAGTVEGVTCREILEELAEKLETKLSFPPEDIVATVADLMTFLRVVSIPGTLKAVRRTWSRVTAGICFRWELSRGFLL